jgi:hypothetical protein
VIIITNKNVNATQNSWSERRKRQRKPLKASFFSKGTVRPRVTGEKTQLSPTQKV